ncbi:MAG: Hsp20/alpha crystallin family protein [Clostridiaceae bacterium]|nr:Hsp20/alpha crystallin family protein [Clostridiaceae bacterium]
MAGLIPFNRRRNELSSSSLFNMMDDFFNDGWPFPRNLMSDTFKVDVKETDEAYTIEAELPGIKKEEIRLALNDDRLTICVQRNEDVSKDTDNYIHRERRRSSMQRAIYLADAHYEGIEAKLNEGILQIVVPKQAKPSSAREIEIK